MLEYVKQFLSPASLEFAEGAEKDELTILCDLCVLCERSSFARASIKIKISL